jgi:hypothetical protein
LAQASGDGQHVESFHAVALDSIQERPYLISGEGLYLLSAGLWRLHGRGGVARYQAIIGRLFECLAKGTVDVQDGAWGQSTVQLLAVEAAHVVGREGLEPDPAERWGQVHTDDALIPLVGLLPYPASDGVRKPAVQILTHGQGASVEDEADFAVGQGLRELRRDLFARLP